MLQQVIFKDGFLVNALRELPVGLCRGNCVMFKRSLYALAHVTGNAYRAGADIRHPNLFKDVSYPFD